MRSDGWLSGAENPEGQIAMLYGAREGCILDEWVLDGRGWLWWQYVVLQCKKKAAICTGKSRIAMETEVL